MFYVLCANAILCKCAIVLQCANVLQYPGSHAIVFLAKCSALCFVQGLTAFVAYSQQIVLRGRNINLSIPQAIHKAYMALDMVRDAVILDTILCISNHV